jgi:hypothetical protein
MSGHDLGAGHDADGQFADPAYQGLMRAEALSPVDQEHGVRERGQRQRPVKGAVAAADDDDVLPSVVFRPRHEVGKPIAFEAADRVKPAGRERAYATGHHHEPGQDPYSRRRSDQGRPVDETQPARFPAEEVSRPVAPRLSRKARDQVPAADFGKPGHVVDHLFRVHRRHLTADLRQRVRNRDGQPAEPCTVGGVETHWTSADDQGVHLGIDPGGDRQRQGTPSSRGLRSYHYPQKERPKQHVMPTMLHRPRRRVRARPGAPSA